MNLPSPQTPTLSRPLSFYQSLATSPEAYNKLPEEAKYDCASDLLVLYVKARGAELTEPEREALHAASVVLERLEGASLQGLALSFHPCKGFPELRFVEAIQLPEAFAARCARASDQMPGYVAVFVDPEEFHFRTFENIVPLDTYFSGAKLNFSMTESTRSRSAHEIHHFDLGADHVTQAHLMSLDGLGLYLKPLNASSRGGKRYIFHAESLSQRLTEALRAALPADLLEGFSHVNPVFRCNHFEPGEAPFKSHVDTPYYDAERYHVSRYTMLLYLTGGEAKECLRIEDRLSLNQIDAMSCVLFHQSLEHAGAPYEDGNKVFLRTELIFEAPDVIHDPSLAQIFSKACYMTGESVHLPELSEYMHRCYDRVAKGHWVGVEDEEITEPFVHKQYKGTSFVTNGYDFWFHKDQVTLQEAAALAVLDYFNCKIDDVSFRKLCTSDVLPAKERGEGWLTKLLESYGTQRTNPCTTFDAKLLFPRIGEPDERVCCPFHTPSQEELDEYGYEDINDDGPPPVWSATRCPDIVHTFENAQAQAKSIVQEAPILFMGQHVMLNLENFIIQGDKILITSNQHLAPVNFAACWNYGGMPSSYLGLDVTLDKPNLLIPPLLFRMEHDCIHLMCDFFRNSWMVQQAPPQQAVVPKILDLSPDEAEEVEGLEMFEDF